MSVNYKWLSAGKRPTRGQVKLLRRDAHGLQTTPAVPAFHFQPTMTIAVTEGGCHLLLERRGVSPRRTAKGDVANRLGAALRYRRNFFPPTRPGFDFEFGGFVYDYLPSFGGKGQFLFAATELECTGRRRVGP